MLKAVIFDSDGTLINSFELIVAAHAHLSKLHNLNPPTAEEIRPLLALALPMPDIFRKLYPGVEPDLLMAANGDFVVKNAAKAAAFAGIHEMLQELKAMGLKLAIVTGGNHKIHDILMHHDIDRHFESVVHCDRVTRGKPHPEGVLLALEELGVQPGQAVMVGDSKSDILAGKNAEVAHCIGVTHGHGAADDLRSAGAEYVVDSLAEVLATIQTLHKQ
jgi:HAD superfamily hydrolase (TIGR01549 family)